MAIGKSEVERAAALFRELLARTESTVAHAVATAGAPEGGSTAPHMSEPHAFYVVDGRAVLDGELTAAARLPGYQSVVVENETPVEVLNAAAVDGQIEYTGAWSTRAAEALGRALKVAEEQGVADENFHVITVPEVAFNGVWFPEHDAIVPLQFSSKKSALDAGRVYTPAELISELQQPLRAKFAVDGGASADSSEDVPPRA